ncbi:hypothetical protein [Prolixibacter sp. NT017]|uniref:hypothetical protein n=1 Tax=Prolixibacter sp. NT017 TaxID=2652390 RepID=UPI0012715F82|nr:hypothetical protein [Prolixibacter sp. NT017]GET26894.1 hypothetical protein NT017_32230 [Prolixibacter sp. NT017]
MKRLHVLLSVGLILMGLASCNKKSKPDYTTTVDVFSQTKVYNNDTVHGIVYSAITLASAASVEVQTPDGQTVPLDSYDGSGYSYYLQTPDSEMTSTVPVPGTYTFSVNFSDGMTATETNDLTSEFLYPPHITIAEYQADASSVHLKWDKVANADGYQVKVFSGDTQVYNIAPFAGGAGQDTVELSIPTSYLSGYVPGTLKFEVIALKFETSAYTSIQTISTTDREITIN